MVAQQQPNLYALNGRRLHVTYTSSGLDGRPRFTYQDALATRGFSGDEIAQTDTDLGTVVTVTTARTVDSGSTTFSLILPRTTLVNGQPAHIRTLGITTLHRLTVDTPLHGQLDTYQTHTLSGTASYVQF